MTQFVDPVHLRQVLTQYYDTGELQTMCFDLGIDYDSIGGDGKSQKVAKLVLYAQRNGRINDLAAYVRQTRSFIKLRMTDTLPELPEMVPGSSTGKTIVVKGDYVEGDKMDGDKVQGDKITVGDVSGTGIAIGSQASATVTTITQAAPQDKADFTQQLEELKALLAKAIADGEFDDKDDGQTAAKNLDKALNEVKKDAPKSAQIKSRLELASGLIEAGAKAGAAVLKATPIIAGLIKVIGVIF